MFGIPFLPSFGDIKIFLIIGVIALALGVNGYLAYQAIQGANYKVRAEVSEKSIETIGDTDKAVKQADEVLRDTPIDKALCAKGWLNDCVKGDEPVGLFSRIEERELAKMNHPKMATKVPAIGEPYLKRADEPKKVKTAKRRKTTDWWCANFGFCTQPIKMVYPK